MLQREIDVRSEQPTALSLSSALAKITRDPALTSGELKMAIDMLATEGCEALGCSRVGIWVIDKRNNCLKNLTAYDIDSGTLSVLENFDLTQRANYITLLQTERLVVIDDANEADILPDLRAKPVSVLRSLLDAPVRVGGELIGVVCIEHRNRRRTWTMEEQNFASSLADFTALALEAMERRKMMDALNESKRGTETLMCNIPGMVYQCINDPPDIRFTFVSEGCYQLTGYTPEELLRGNADKFFDMIHPDDVMPLKKLNQETLDVGLPLDTSFRLVMRDGSIKWIWERSRVVETNPDGTPHILEGFYTDITEQRRLEAADIANRAKSEFLANMSHEIRTPMNAILGMTELALNESPSPQIVSFLNNIKSAGNTLMSIINDILDFSKIEAGAMEINPTRYYAASLINDIATMTYVRIGKKRIQLIVDDDPNLPSVMMGDVTKVKQVAINLLTNAVKFTHNGYIRLGVSGIVTAPGKILLKITVEDTGIGIKADDLPRLFENFAQLDTKKNRSVEGTGLGLAITQKLTNLMGGNIAVESEYGRGSTFTATLMQDVVLDCPMITLDDPGRVRVAVATDEPVLTDSLVGKIVRMGGAARAVTPKDDISGDTHFIIDQGRLGAFASRPFSGEKIVLLSEYIPQRGDADAVHRVNMPVTAQLLANLLDNRVHEHQGDDDRESNEPFSIQGADILVVDDNEMNLLIAESILNNYDANVTLARSGYEAFALVERNRFDIIFMDHMMPDLDGVETTRMLRKHKAPWLKTVPIIALTANAISGVKEMFIDSGMNDFLSKPLEMHELRRVLLQWTPKEKISFSKMPHGSRGEDFS